MAMLSDLQALGAALAGVLVVLAFVAMSGRIFKPGPMFDPQRFARLLVAEIAMRHTDRASAKFQEAVERSRRVFLARFPNDGPVYDAAIASILRGTS
jgi:hypothetical protein